MKEQKEQQSISTSKVSRSAKFVKTGFKIGGNYIKHYSKKVFNPELNKDELNADNATGYISDVGRKNIASYLVRNLKINWTWGAAYFEDKLIDYSPASNWGNWAHIAGVGYDPKAYRQFDVVQQAREFDPKGDYTDKWIAEFETIAK